MSLEASPCHCVCVGVPTMILETMNVTLMQVVPALCLCVCVALLYVVCLLKCDLHLFLKF